MKKVLVTYCSQTGNTEKVAKAIFHAISAEKELIPFADVTSLDDYDTIFVGFPIYNFEPIESAKKFMMQHLKVKNVALFITMSLTAVPLDDTLKGLYEMTINNCKKFTVESNLIGVFDCPGELSEPVAEALMASNDAMLQSFGKMREFTIGYPNAKNIEDAGAFAKSIMLEKETA